MSRFVGFLFKMTMSAFATNFLGIPFRITSEFLDLGDFSKGTMLQSDEKLAQKLAPLQITETKKHTDVIIIKNRSSGKIDFYLKLQEQMVEVDELNRLDPGNYNKMQEFFAEKDLDEFYFLILNDYENPEMMIFAKHKITNFADVFFPLDSEIVLEFENPFLDFLKNKAFAGDKIDWENGEFAFELGKLTHLNRNFGEMSILVRTFKDRFTFQDEFRQMGKYDFWADNWYNIYEDERPSFEVLKMFCRNADIYTIETVLIRDTHKFHYDVTAPVIFPHLLKILLERGLNPNVKITVPVNEGTTSVNNFARTDGANQSLIHIIANRSWEAAGRKHKLQMIKLLHKANANIKELAGNGENALFFMFKLDESGVSLVLSGENHFTSSKRFQTDEFEVFKYLIETCGIDPFEKNCSEIWWDLKRWRNQMIKNYLVVLKLKCFGVPLGAAGNIQSFACQHSHYIFVIGLALIISFIYNYFGPDILIRLF